MGNRNAVGKHHSVSNRKNAISKAPSHLKKLFISKSWKRNVSDFGKSRGKFKK